MFESIIENAKKQVSVLAETITGLKVETTTTTTHKGKTSESKSVTRVVLPEKKISRKNLVDFIKPKGWEIRHTTIDPNGRYETWEVIDIDRLVIRRTVCDHGIVKIDPYETHLSGTWRDCVRSVFRANRNYIAATYLYPNGDTIPHINLDEFSTRFIEMVLQHKEAPICQEIIRFINDFINEINNLFLILEPVKTAHDENEKLRADLLDLRSKKTSAVLDADALREENEELKARIEDMRKQLIKDHRELAKYEELDDLADIPGFNDI